MLLILSMSTAMVSKVETGCTMVRVRNHAARQHAERSRTSTPLLGEIFKLKSLAGIARCGHCTLSDFDLMSMLSLQLKMAQAPALRLARTDLNWDGPLD